MRLWAHRYSLQPRSFAGASLRKREGALIRVELESCESPGFADCHPWPELGDAPLEEQLAHLSQSKSTALAARTLELARLDARARSDGRWLFEGLEIPESHATLVGGGRERDFSDRLESLCAAGFKRIKVKVSGVPGDESAVLRAVRERLIALGVKLRLDFNEKPSVGQCAGFLDAAGCSPEWIDWIEDPCAFDPKAWSKLKSGFGLRIAIDRPICREATEAQSFDVVVLKPAIAVPELVAAQARAWDKELCVTSYLDHPIGQAAAAWVAARLGVASCGITTHEVYEANLFSEKFSVNCARLVLPEGTGFGWDKELSSLSWEAL